MRQAAEVLICCTKPTSQLGGFVDKAQHLSAVHKLPSPRTPSEMVRMPDNLRLEALIERLLAGPEDNKLTPKQWALLSAYLDNYRLSFAAVQREKRTTGASATLERLQKLRRIRDFNRNLQAAERRTMPPPATKPEVVSDCTLPRASPKEEHCRTEPDTADDAIVRQDPYDENVAWCMGKRIYLGRGDTQLKRLFWLLAKPFGRACSLAEVQRAVDGVETSVDLNVSAEDVRKAGQRVRKAISKLRERLREWGADEYLKIIPGGDAKNPEYTMVFNIPRNR